MVQQSRLLVLVLLSAAVVVDAAAACQAKYRWQWLYTLKDSGESSKQLPRLFSTWMRDDCKKVSPGVDGGDVVLRLVLLGK